MMILFRNDDLAQIVIHTANMVAEEWENLTQGVWRSPLLRLLPSGASRAAQRTQAAQGGAVGSGAKFKLDLLAYLRAYPKTCAPLISHLA